MTEKITAVLLRALVAALVLGLKLCILEIGVKNFVYLTSATASFCVLWLRA
jgi:hypothetical protein